MSEKDISTQTVAELLGSERVLAIFMCRLEMDDRGPGVMCAGMAKKDFEDLLRKDPTMRAGIRAEFEKWFKAYDQPKGEEKSNGTGTGQV